MKNNSVAGNTLISVLFFLIVLGVISKPLMDFYESWKGHKAVIESNERIEAINASVRNYVTANGRYPCPAPIDAPFDTNTFGKEAQNGCVSGTAAGAGPGTGIERPEGRDKAYVRIGAVPVRTLGLPDQFIHDGYGHRYVYSITEAYAALAPDLKSSKPAIMLVDDNGNVATEEEGNIIFTVIGMGSDEAGSYNKNGMLIADCNKTSSAGENCDMDATFKNTVNKSDSAGKKFTQTVRFQTGKGCVNAYASPPAKVAYLMDTSGSMATKSTCPPGYKPNCTRMDAAQWAMRRGLAGRQYQAKTDSTLNTSFSGFIGDPNKLADANNASYSLGANEDYESKVGQCPSGGTPLGEHIQALAARIGPGESVDRPNTILVISDGEHTGKVNPLDVAKNLGQQYGGKLVIHIIDMGNNPSLQKVAEATTPGQTDENKKGRYLSTTNPEDVKKFLLTLSGSCEDTNIDEPTDKRPCGGGFLPK